MGSNDLEKHPSDTLPVVHHSERKESVVYTSDGGVIIPDTDAGGKALNTLAYCACFSFACASFLFGYDNNVIGPIVGLRPFVEKYQGVNPKTGEYVFTARNQDFLFSVPLTGSIFGALVASPLQTRFGRKWPLVCTFVLSIAGVMMQTFAPNIACFVVGRFWNTFVTGVASATSPLYLSEIVPASMRGRAVSSINILTLTAGVLATVIVWGTHNIDGANSYRIPLGLQCVPPGILIPVLALMPESPQWLVQKGRNDEARKNLRKLRGYTDAQVDDELRVMIECERNERELSANVHFWDLFRRGNLKRTLTAGACFSFNQISGIILSSTYATVFLQQLGVGQPFTLTIIASCCVLAGCIVGPFVVDRGGRRPTALVGMSFLLGIDIIAGGLAFRDLTNKNTALAIAALSFIFNFFWGASFYSLSNLLPSEIATPKLRNLTMSYTIAWAQTTAVITTFAVPQLTSADAANLGAKTYLVFGGCMACILVAVWFFLPETRNRSFAEIDEMYDNKVPMWKWRNYKTMTTAKQAVVVQASAIHV